MNLLLRGGGNLTLENKMKITKQRLRKIIKEELDAFLEQQSRSTIIQEDLLNENPILLALGQVLKDPKVLQMIVTTIGPIVMQYLAKSGAGGGAEDSGAPIAELSGARVAMKPGDLSEAGEKQDLFAGNKLVSRDGKKKGIKISGTWKSGKIKVKWVGEEGIHNVDRPEYTRKSW
jgi:hypothetical protein